MVDCQDRRIGGWEAQKIGGFPAFRLTALINLLANKDLPC